MSNRTPRPPVLPSPFALSPGRDIDGGIMRPLGESMNTGIADIAVGHIAQQSYPDGIVWSGAGGDPVCQWRPVYSEAQPEATVVIEAEADVGGCTVSFGASGAVDSVALAVPLARGRVTGILALGELAAGRENIKMTIAAVGGAVTLYRIAIRYTPADAGPIPTGLVDGAYPLGVDGGFDDGMPLSSGRAGRLVDTQGELLDNRRRNLLTWSDAAGVTYNAQAALRGFPLHLIRGRVPRWVAGSFPAIFRAEGGAEDETLRIDTAGSEVTVGAGNPEGWYSGTAAHSGPVDATIFGVDLRRMSVKTTGAPGQAADPDALAVGYSVQVEGP